MSAQDERTNVEKAHEAWGKDCPDWVIALANECDESAQSKVGKRLGHSSGSICSSIINNNYNGDMAKVEKRIRGEFMAATVRCPQMGNISMAVCMDNQEHAKKGNRSSSFRAAMVRACTACKISRIGG